MLRSCDGGSAQLSRVGSGSILTEWCRNRGGTAMQPQTRHRHQFSTIAQQLQSMGSPAQDLATSASMLQGTPDVHFLQQQHQHHQHAIHGRRPTHPAAEVFGCPSSTFATAPSASNAPSAKPPAHSCFSFARSSAPPNIASRLQRRAVGRVSDRLQLHIARASDRGRLLPTGGKLQHRASIYAAGTRVLRKDQ